MAKLSFWHMAGGLVVLGVVGFIMTSPEEVKSSSTSGRTSRTSTAAKKSSDEVFTKQDYDAKFARYEAPVRNAFRPLVESGSGAANRSTLAANQIPESFSGDKVRWIYTGTAVVDGVPMALVENPTTGEGVFLKTGETWKKSIVRAIKPTKLVLEGPSGEARTVELLEDPMTMKDQFASATIQPVTPMTGNIGQPLPPVRSRNAENFTPTQDALEKTDDQK